MPRKRRLSSEAQIELLEYQEPWRNTGLFSDHYLKDRLPKTDWWPKDEVAQPVFERVKTLYDKLAVGLRMSGEGDTEQRFIDKVLEYLGFGRLYKQKLPAIERRQVPDFTLYTSDDEADSARELENQIDRYKTALTILEAKRFGRPLGEPNKTDSKGAKGRYPYQQIRDYLAESERLRWGVLTNGRHWRLYCRDAVSSKFLEVHLERAVKDAETFKYFLCLFAPEAFRVVEGRCRLDDIRYKAGRYQEEVEDDLRERIFDTLEVLAQGFFDFPANGLAKGDLDDIYRHSLIFLYRLLFILNAEANGLLPQKDNSKYQEGYSLSRLKEKIIHSSPRQYVASETFLYERLSKLFHLVNGDDSRKNRDIGVPRYNGGLFDPERYSFLEKNKAPDSVIAEVIKQMGFRKVEEEWHELDYEDLGQRHLGSIYEGLLEHKLILEDAMPTRDQSKGLALTFFRPEDFGRRGWLVLRRSEEEEDKRRQTGSFFTPAFAVSYIVERSLSPLLDKIERKHKGKPKKDDSFAEAVLALKVLDPAMGSGHFLVEATRFLAAKIAVHPTTKLHTPHIKDEDELAYWRRRVVESSIFGVDMNPLAVELSKVSLWVATAFKEKALSFLDHHLRVGNSLVGAWTEGLSSLPGGRTGPLEAQHLFEKQMTDKVGSLTSFFRAIEDSPSDSKEEVEGKEKEYKQFRKKVDGYRDLADLWASLYFGNAVADKDYEALTKDLDSPARWAKHSEKSWFKQGKKLATSPPGPFFHWELEFPEVLLRSQPGFDAVIGNPPYIRQERLRPLKPFLKTFPCNLGTADIYIYFYAQGLRLLKKGGFLGFISSNKFMRSEYGKTLRPMLVGESAIREIVDFGELPVFTEAATFPAIVLVEKMPYGGEPVRYCQVKALPIDSLPKLVEEKGTDLGPGAFAGANWSLGSEEETGLMRKMERVGVPLGEYVKGKIKYGVKRGVTTGLNEAFVIDASIREKLIKEDPRSDEIIKPLIVGDDIRRYQTNFQDRYLIFSRQGTEIEKYPAIKNHLLLFQKQLTPKEASDQTGPGRKPGPYLWFEIQDTVDYFEDFDKPKIVLPDIAISSRFSMDVDSRYYLTNTGYIIAVQDYYLLALLNSPLIEYYYRKTSSVLGDPNKRGRMRFIYQYLERIPIRRIVDSTSKELRGESIQRLLETYQKGNSEEVLKGVEACLKKKPEQADVVQEVLAHLAKEMLRLHKEKQAEQKRFADYLIQSQGLTLDRDKTPLSNFYDLEWEAFRQGLTKRKVDTQTWAEPVFRNIITEFEARRSAIRILLSSIQFTDHLIDRIVYLLYGLTPDEINLLETSNE